MTWCHVPNTDYPSAQAASGPWIWEPPTIEQAQVTQGDLFSGGQ